MGVNRRQLMLGSAGAVALAPVSAAARRFGGVGGVAVPASIASPVSGSDLTAIWNLQTSGTGPRTGYAHAWTGSIDAYLTSAGFVMGNNGNLYLNVGSGSVTVSSYDFTGAPGVMVNGTGAATFNDCKFSSTGGVIAPCDTNGNPNYSGSTLATTLNYCLFDVAVFSLPSGSMAFNYCRFKNQAQNLGDTGFTAPGTCALSFDHCYITGGGVTSVAPAHVELSQVNGPAGSTFSLTNTFADISQDGQATRTGSVAGWTGVWSIPSATAVTLSNCILIGLAAVNANAGAPNVVSCVMAYNDTTPMTITNTVMESGANGYTKNQVAGAGRPTDGGGNRSFANAAITAANFN